MPTVALDFHPLSSDDDKSCPMFTVTEVGTGSCFARIVAKKASGERMDWLIPDLIGERRDWRRVEAKRRN